MDIIKGLFPLSFSLRTLKNFVTAVVIYLVIGVIAGLVCKIVHIIPIIGPFVSWLIGAVCGIYVLVGIVLAILVFFGNLN